MHNFAPASPAQRRKPADPAADRQATARFPFFKRETAVEEVYYRDSH
jgi:hypothetical protein